MRLRGHIGPRRAPVPVAVTGNDGGFLIGPGGMRLDPDSRRFGEGGRYRPVVA